MDLGFAEGDADAEDGAFAIGADADGDEHGAVAQETAVAHFFIAGIEDKIGAGVQRAVAPELEFDIEFGGAGTDLGGADLVAAEFLDDFGDLAGGDALDIHLRHCQHEGLLATDAFFEGGGIETDAVAHLGDAELDGPHAGVEGLGLEAIGGSQTPFTTLVRLGLEDGRTLLEHGLVEQEAQAFGEAG